MSRVDDEIGELEARWDGADYTGLEFVPDRAESLRELSTTYDAMAGQVREATAALVGASPEGWTGAAANGYAAFLKDSLHYLYQVREALSAGRAKASTCARAIDAEEGEADRAAAKCNEARATHRRAEEKSLLDPRRLWELLEANSQMGDGLSMAKGARERVREAYTSFIKGLDWSDEILATQDEPQLPLGTTVGDPDNAALLAMIFGPVAAAMAAEGSTARAQRAVGAYEQAMKDDPTGKKARELLEQAAKELTGPELDYLLNHMDENDLATILGTLDPTKDRDFYNLLASKASLPVLARLADTDPNHYWHPANGTDRFLWGDTDGTPGVVPDSDLDDLHQGMLGDCYYLSSLGAVMKNDPDFLKNHVRANPNGTYTVTLYKDGKPVEVTVTPEVPWTANADGSAGTPAYSHDDDGAGWNDDRTLFQIYEKAMAQAHGEMQPEPGTGYGGMNGGDPTKYLPTVTGQPAEYKPADDVEPADLQSAVTEKKPVVISTLGEDDAKGKDIYDPKRVPHLIAGHAYYVDSVNTSADPPTVTVVNPWGRDSKTDGTVTLTWEQFQDMTQGASIGK